MIDCITVILNEENFSILKNLDSVGFNCNNLYFSGNLIKEETIPLSLKYTIRSTNNAIPFSLCHKGENINISESFNFSNHFYSGLIADRHLAATPKPDNDGFKKELQGGVKRAISIHLSELDVYAISLGHTPVDMDDRWFMYCENGIIRYYRSWKQELIYKAQIKDNMIEELEYCPTVNMSESEIIDLFCVLINRQIDFIKAIKNIK